MGPQQINTRTKKANKAKITQSQQKKAEMKRIIATKVGAITSIQRKALIKKLKTNPHAHISFNKTKERKTLKRLAKKRALRELGGDVAMGEDDADMKNDNNNTKDDEQDKDLTVSVGFTGTTLGAPVKM